MTLPTLQTEVLAAGGAESLPSPTLFVILYATLWIGLVGWLGWLATRQHSVDRDITEIGDALQSRLEQVEAQQSRLRE